MRPRHRARLRTLRTGRIVRSGLIVAALAFGLIACGASLADLEPVASRIEPPSDWEQVASEGVERGCGDPVESCPRIELTYVTPSDDDFGSLMTDVLEAAGLEVWDPPSAACHTNADTGCNVGARGGGVAAAAIVTGRTAETRMVTIRLVEDSSS